MAARAEKQRLLPATARAAHSSAPTYSKNVPRIMLYQLVDGICFSVWQATVLQVLLYDLGGNSLVGWLSGVSGAAQVVGAGVGSWAADKSNRRILVRCGAFSGAVASIVSLLATYFEALPLFWVSSVNWGMYMGMSNPAVEALFGDSIATGHRASLYTYKWMIQVFSYVFGYLLNLVLFLRLGDEWTTPEVKIVMYTGLIMHYVAFMLLLLADDDHVLPPEPSPPGSPAAPPSASGSPSQASPKSAADVTAAEKFVSAFPEAEEENEAACSLLRWPRIPLFITIGDFMLSLGSGMTLRYLPLFFINEYSVSPVALMSVMIGISFGTTAVAAGVRVVGERLLGRIPTILIVRLLGCSGLLYLAVAWGPAAHVIPMCAVWVVRNSMMNSTLGLSRSVIMDFVPKGERARWSAVESFTNFSWAGSAVIGGYVADAHGYKGTFLVTVAFHIAASLVIIPAMISAHTVERWIMAEAAAEREAKRIDAMRSGEPLSGDIDSKLSIQ